MQKINSALLFMSLLAVQAGCSTSSPRKTVVVKNGFSISLPLSVRMENPPHIEQGVFVFSRDGRDVMTFRVTGDDQLIATCGNGRKVEVNGVVWVEHKCRFSGTVCINREARVYGYDWVLGFCGAEKEDQSWCIEAMDSIKFE
jgi:hypothetical protein